MSIFLGIGGLIVAVVLGRKIFPKKSTLPSGLGEEMRPHVELK